MLGATAANVGGAYQTAPASTPQIAPSAGIQQPINNNVRTTMPIETVQSTTTIQSAPLYPDRNSYRSRDVNEVSTDEYVIPNAPKIAPSSMIELTAVGLGVPPENTSTPAQAMALAKRAAIVDAYRQIGEKMYGIRVNAQDTVRDVMVKNSTVKTKVLAVIRNAEIIETVYDGGLCQVSMELKLDGKRWYRILSGEEF
ncbi:hypothetical protein CCZ01_00060 [Helicobacter monodelphidis]|nr:hypothetical protein CCZ01_00060 [Helicobacter sp. 15-1451]